MHHRHAFVALVLTLAIAPALDACVMQIVDYDVTTVCAAGTCWVTYYEVWNCVGDGGGYGPPAPPPGPGGGGSQTPPLRPSIEIVSMSDVNPGAPVLTIRSTNATRIDLYIGGYQTNSYPADTTTIILPSLDPSSGSLGRTTALELKAISGTTGLAESAYLAVDRPMSPVSQQAGLYVRYYEYLDYQQIRKTEVDMRRNLMAVIIYANYSCPTVGARNGRVYHLTVEDVIGWEGTHPEPAWSSEYRINGIPGPPGRLVETSCSARFWPGPTTQRALCVSPTTFVADGSRAIAAIVVFGMGGFPELPTYFVPNEIELTVP